MGEPWSNLTGKHLLLVGGAWNRPAQGFWYEVAQGMGLQLSVADKPGHWTEEVVGSLVHSFYPIDLDTSNESLADKLVETIAHSEVQFSGILTLNDAYLISVAKAAEKLGMATVGSEVYRNTRDKERVRILTGSPVLKCRIRNKEDLKEASKVVGFPAVLKPVQGSGSLAVHLVKSAHELEKVYTFLKSKLPSIKNLLGGIPDFMLEQYIDGTEHNVDLIIQNGETLFAAVSDDQSGKEPWFQEAQLTHPSKLSIKDQKALIHSAADACSKVNITDGVVHIELKLSNGVAQLLEVNARMGCRYTAHGIKAVWGVELIQHVYEIALGSLVSQLPNKGSLGLPSHPPSIFAVAKYVNTPYSGCIGTDNFLKPLYHNDRVSLVLPLARKGQKVKGPEDDIPDVLAYFMITGTTSLESTEEAAEEAIRSLKISEVLVI